VIIQRYTDFRAVFALFGAALDSDGFEAMPIAKLRSASFSTLVAPVITAFPFTLTVNGSTVDGGFGFDWYLSQRTDDHDVQALTLTPFAANKSGSVVVGLNAINVAKLLPGVTGAGLVTPASLALLFKHVALYVQRRSDKAYQWVALYPVPVI
jgi:hypothetical protein